MRLRVSCVLALALLALWVLPAGAQQVRPDKSANATQGGGLDGTDVVAYDPPGPPDAMVGTIGNWVGNVFDTRVGIPLETGNISFMAFLNGDAGGTFPVWGVFNNAGTAPILTASGSGIVPFTYNTVPFTIASIGPGFLAGVKVGVTFTSCADSVGVQSQSTLGMGFHGASFGGGVAMLPNQNGMVRVSGSIWVPVELMNFDVSK